MKATWHQKLLLVLGLTMALAGALLMPISAYADSDSNCFASSFYQPADASASPIDVTLPVACDDHFKSLYAANGSTVPFDPAQCYNVGYNGNNFTEADGSSPDVITTDCLTLRATAEQSTSENSPFINAGGDAGKFLAIYVAGGGTVAPSTPPGGTAPATDPNTTPTTPTAPSGSGATTGTSTFTFAPGTESAYVEPTSDGQYYCGLNQGKEVHLSIDLGCVHKDPAILDMIFAITRLLSDGVGIIVVASIVFAGIQYTASRGDPQQTAQAQTRVLSSVIALLIFLFSYAILNWLVPAGLLH